MACSPECRKPTHEGHGANALDAWKPGNQTNKNMQPSNVTLSQIQKMDQRFQSWPQARQFRSKEAPRQGKRAKAWYSLWARTHTFRPRESGRAVRRGRSSYLCRTVLVGLENAPFSIRGHGRNKPPNCVSGNLGFCARVSRLAPEPASARPATIECTLALKALEGKSLHRRFATV